MNMENERDKEEVESAIPVRPTLQELAAAAHGAEGLQCPRCGSRDFRVIKTGPKGTLVKRRRVCRHCGYRVTTHERLAR